MSEGEGKSFIPVLQRKSSGSANPENAKDPVARKSSFSSLSRPGSPASVSSEGNEDLPTNISSEEQLKSLPNECLSGDKNRPLRHVHEDGSEAKYALRPMMYSVFFILLVELFERFAFYGINYTQTSFLTGAYNEDWNANMEAVAASTYVSISVAVAFTTPFIGAFLADSLLGEFRSLLVGSLIFYVPGLSLIFATSVPHLLGPEFNRKAMAVGLLFLWPCGTGIVKSVVNVFGAKQFHPILQSSLIEAYYVKFYMCINVGALVGGTIVPVLAQKNVSLAYFIPVAMLSVAVTTFVLGTSRYVRDKPKGNLFNKKKKKNVSLTNEESIGLSVIFRITLLVVPFNIGYSQMATSFILQGTVMEPFGYIDAACMNNGDAVSVLMFGYLIGNKFYPWIASRGIKIPTTYKFAIGSALSALAVICALIVERMIHYEYENHGRKISILWQSASYFLIGIGEIFAVSAAYEAAFNAAPPEKKVLASACNLFCVGGLPNFLCIVLYHVCTPWFTNNHGTTSISRLQDYSTAHVEYYFWLLFGISLFGVVINLLPQVQGFVESVEEKAADLAKTPKTPSMPPRRERESLDEESPLIRVARHQAYLKYGSGPVLYKQGSMRAASSLSQRHMKERRVKRKVISQLYGGSDPVLPGVGTLISSKGTPVHTRAMLIPPKSIQQQHLERPKLARSLSN